MIRRRRALSASAPAAGRSALTGTGAATAHSVTRASGTALTASGKPEVLYIGAGYCPFCATERWPLAVALSRFGTFSGLHGIHSTSNDVYPNQPTLTFYKSSYTSKYLTFVPVETTTQDRNTPLQRPTAAEQALLRRYDAPPYVPAFFMAGQQLTRLGRVTEARDVLRDGIDQARASGDAHAAGEMSEFLVSLGAEGE